MSNVALGTVLELRGVRAGYDAVGVLHGIDVTVRAGEVLAVLGPNGAGKSTLLSVMAGLLRPTSGDLVLGGRTMTGANPTELARRGLCLIPEGRGVFPNLTVEENLWLLTNRGVSRADVEAQAYARFPRLQQRRKQLAGSMSGGEQQMLAMSRAITTDPAVLLLDELSMGLAPLIVDELYESVAAIAATGVTVVVVEQFVRSVMHIATRGAVLIGGQFVLEGDLLDISSQLHTAYLSGTPDEEPST
jgi:branched-chain amino acid transport system ATP-binding protein